MEVREKSSRRAQDCEHKTRRPIGDGASRMGKVKEQRALNLAKSRSLQRVVREDAEPRCGCSASKVPVVESTALPGSLWRAVRESCTGGGKRTYASLAQGASATAKAGMQQSTAALQLRLGSERGVRQTAELRGGGRLR